MQKNGAKRLVIFLLWKTICEFIFQIMKQVLLIVSVTLSFTSFGVSQTTTSSCDSLSRYWDKFFQQFDYGSVTYMESAPELITSNDSLIVKIKGQDSLFYSKDQFKVFVTFFVNEQGDPICIKIIKPESLFIQNIVIKKVEEFKFKPAIIDGKISVVPMALQLLFIKD